MAREPFLQGTIFPNLKHFGLRDSEIADEIAVALESAPLLSRIESLDLSLGMLSDEGGQALVDNPGLKHLKQLDLHRHYLSDDMMMRLKLTFPAVNLDEAQGDDVDEDDRNVAVTD